MTYQIYDRTHFNNALKCTRSTGANVSALSAYLPVIVQNGPALAAYRIACAPSYNRRHWLPEAMALFNTDNLSSRQKRHMVRAIFDIEDHAVNDQTALALADISGAIGRYGFSFPQWRFVSQSFKGGPSLLEHFGMARQSRPNDVRAPDLPRHNPQRDEFGTGFTWTDGEWSVEYRRAYILCANHTAERAATLVIRNNSYFFGRDRLPAPFYATFTPMAPDDLHDLNIKTLEHSGVFVRWQNIVNAPHGLPIAERVARTEMLLNFLDGFDMDLSLWLQNEHGGRAHLVDFLQSMQDAHDKANKQGAPLYLAHIDAHMPPWHPTHITEVNHTTIQNTKSGAMPDPRAGTKFVMLSGPDGDWPLRPTPRKPVSRNAAPRLSR